MVSKKDEKSSHNADTPGSAIMKLNLLVYQPCCTLLQVFRNIYPFMNEEKLSMDWDRMESDLENFEEIIQILIIFDPFLRIFQLFHYLCNRPSGKPSKSQQTRERCLLGFILYFCMGPYVSETEEVDKLIKCCRDHMVSKVAEGQYVLAEKLLNERYNTVANHPGNSSAYKHYNRFKDYEGGNLIEIGKIFPTVWKNLVHQIRVSNGDDLDEDNESESETPKIDLDENGEDQHTEDVLQDTWISLYHKIKSSQYTLDQILNSPSESCARIRNMTDRKEEPLRVIFHLNKVLREEPREAILPLAKVLYGHLQEYIGDDLLPTSGQTDNTLAEHPVYSRISATFIMVVLSRFETLHELKNEQVVELDSDTKHVNTEDGRQPDSNKRKLEVQPKSGKKKKRSKKNQDQNRDLDKSPKSGKSKSEDLGTSSPIDSSSNSSNGSSNLDKETSVQGPLSGLSSSSSSTSNSSRSTSSSSTSTKVSSSSTTGSSSSAKSSSSSDPKSSLENSENPSTGSTSLTPGSVESPTVDSSSSIKTSDEFKLMIMQLNTEEEKNAFMLNHCKTLVLPAYKDALDLIMSRSFP